LQKEERVIFHRKIKLYADEDIPSAVVKFMRNTLHWDIKYVCEQKSLQEKKDLYHHKKAREEKRIILTRDKDYLDPCRFPYHKSTGVIIIKGKEVKNMVYILHLLPCFLEQMLKERLYHFPFFKMIASTSGVRLRYQEVTGKIEEKFYPWVLERTSKTK